MLAIDTPVPSSQAPTVSWEMNDVRPISKPARPAPGEARGRPLKLVDLFFMVNQYADGFDAVLLYDAGKYEPAGLERLVDAWMESWEKLC